MLTGEYSKEELETYILSRTSCKSGQTHGCKKIELFFDFDTFLTEPFGFPNVPLTSPSGNRF